MSRPLTEPSTPLRRVTRPEEDYANYSAPTRSRVSAIHLPPHELSGVLSEMSSRRASAIKQIPSPHRSIRSPSNRLRTSMYGARDTPLRSVASSRNTPTRKISDHLTIRRRRRSSTGAVYDAAFSGAVNKDFLRLFSRTLVKEKKQVSEEPDDEVYKALDKQHRIFSVSPQGPVRDFDMSLPLPSDDEMNSPVILSPVRPPEKAPIFARNDLPKPAFKSYLEQILESRNRQSSRAFGLAFDKESSEERHPEEVKSIISTSRFIIENTLSGLPESWTGENHTTQSLQLAEPVAFGLLHDDGSSNESSEKENALPTGEVSYRPARSPRIGLGNKTPENYDIQFDNIDHLDVPSWEPIPVYNDASASTEPQTYPEDSFGGDFMQDEELVDVARSDSDSSRTEIIQGHLTVDNEDIIADDAPFVLPDPDAINEGAPSPPGSSTETRIPSTRPRIPRSLELPKNLVKGFVSVAQHLSTGSPPRKKKKMLRLNTDLVSLISQKSNDFLSQVMSDLGAYADHRESDQINISDALLFVNRIKSHHKLLGQDIEFPMLAQSVFPLESLVSLDNSLQESVKTSLRRGRPSASKHAQKDESFSDEEM